MRQKVLKLAPIGLGATALIVAAVGVYWARSDRPRRAVVPESPQLAAAHRDRKAADEAFGSKPDQAKVEYTAFVEKHKSDKDAQVQDEVGSAEIHLGYLAAQKGDFEASRKEFLQATKIQGTGAMNADFGGVPDQAAYQAIVCLVAEHKEDEAKKQFRSFIKERPLSPLVTAAFRRLRRLNDNQIDPADEALLQSATSKQEKHIRFETSVCGPKTIEYLLSRNLIKATKAHTPTDYKTLAKLCGTRDSGTTLDGLRTGLKALGIESFGAQLNRRDFAKIPGPAIYLDGDHYLALLAVHSSSMTVYDSRYGSEMTMPLPPIDDHNFAATVLTFSLPDLTEDVN